MPSHTGQPCNSPSPPVIVDPPPGPKPVAGRSELVQRVRGRVRVRLKGKKRFVRLTAGRLLPDGSEIDTTKGVARIVVAARRKGTKTAFAIVSGGRAIIDQNRSKRPRTTLKLSQRLSCSSAKGATTSKKRRKRRSLFTRTDGGRFRTRGRHGAAAATGTAWRTIDRCRSTGVRVREGTVRVRDLVRKKTIKVSAGKRYIIRARKR